MRASSQSSVKYEIFFYSYTTSKHLLTQMFPSCQTDLIMSFVLIAGDGTDPVHDTQMVVNSRSRCARDIKSRSVPMYHCLFWPQDRGETIICCLHLTNEHWVSVHGMLVITFPLENNLLASYWESWKTKKNKKKLKSQKMIWWQQR